MFQKWQNMVLNSRSQNFKFKNSCFRTTGNNKNQNVTLNDMQKTICNIFEDFGLDTKGLTKEVGFEQSTVEKER